MKWWSNSYHMLISSLPALPPRFDVERLPISFERLQGRLRMLEPEDAEEIERLLAVLRWANQFEEPSDVAVVQRYDALMGDITNPLVRDILAHAMDVRMIGVALRSRHRGLPLPAVGIGQWFDHIRHNFNQPDFKLGQVFPWIPAVCAGSDVDVPEETGRGLLLQLRSRGAVHRALGHYTSLAATPGRARAGHF
jgi:hypothetical protein